MLGLPSGSPSSRSLGRHRLEILTARHGSSEAPVTRAAALQALTLGWPESGNLNLAVEQAPRAGPPALQFAAINARAKSGNRLPADRSDLLRLSDRRADLDFTLRREIAGI